MNSQPFTQAHTVASKVKDANDAAKIGAEAAGETAKGLSSGTLGSSDIVGELSRMKRSARVAEFMGKVAKPLGHYSKGLPFVETFLHMVATEERLHSLKLTPSQRQSADAIIGKLRWGDYAYQGVSLFSGGKAGLVADAAGLSLMEPQDLIDQLFSAVPGTEGTSHEISNLEVFVHPATAADPLAGNEFHTVFLRDTVLGDSEAKQRTVEQFTEYAKATIDKKEIDELNEVADSEAASPTPEQTFCTSESVPDVDLEVGTASFPDLSCAAADSIDSAPVTDLSRDISPTEVGSRTEAEASLVLYEQPIESELSGAVPAQGDPASEFQSKPEVDFAYPPGHSDPFCHAAESDNLSQSLPSGVTHCNSDEGPGVPEEAPIEFLSVSEAQNCTVVGNFATLEPANNTYSSLNVWDQGEETLSLWDIPPASTDSILMEELFAPPASLNVWDRGEGTADIWTVDGLTGSPPLDINQATCLNGFGQADMAPTDAFPDVELIDDGIPTADLEVELGEEIDCVISLDLCPF